MSRSLHKVIITCFRCKTDGHALPGSCWLVQYWLHKILAAGRCVCLCQCVNWFRGFSSLQRHLFILTRSCTLGEIGNCDWKFKPNTMSCAGLTLCQSGWIYLGFSFLNHAKIAYLISENPVVASFAFTPQTNCTRVRLEANQNQNGQGPVVWPTPGFNWVFAPAQTNCTNWAKSSSVFF